MASDASFDTASLQGTYAFSATGWGGQAPVAAIGLLTFDGAGAVSGRALHSVPGERFGDRRLVEAAVDGTYRVEPNGTGTTVPAGGGEPDLLFAITAVDRPGDGARAEEVSFVFRALDATAGTLMTALATRLPDDGAFTTASLSGVYVGAAVGRGGQSAAAGFGVLAYDGKGGFAETNISNVQAGSFRDRALVAGTDRGVYSVNADGTGTVANGGVVFVITRAEVIDGVRRAREYAFIVRDLVPATGSHFTGVTKRRSD